MTIVDYIKQNSATEFLKPTKNKQIVLLPTNLINLLLIILFYLLLFYFFLI